MNTVKDINDEMLQYMQDWKNSIEREKVSYYHQCDVLKSHYIDLICRLDNIIHVGSSCIKDLDELLQKLSS